MFNIQDLIDDEKCYAEVRKLRWPEGVRCPKCGSAEVTKRGKHTRQKQRQRYHCQACSKDFDDLTDSIFAGHHQPLKVWVVCLYLMGLNQSNQQIAQELDLHKDDVQEMTSQLRAGVEAKKSRLPSAVRSNVTKSTWSPVTKVSPKWWLVKVDRVGGGGSKVNGGEAP
jgi:transposase-like protein